MLTTLAALTLVSVAYGFPSDRPLHYDMRVEFDGFLPIFGGQQGKVQVDLGYQVQGLSPDVERNATASGDITAFRLLFNGAEFPMQIESVKEFFPKTTVSYTPQGRVVKSDAPDVQLPVRLPGLDPKRLADLVVLPIEFPTEGIESGRAWSYSRPFVGSAILYTVTPTEITDEKVNLDVVMTQRYELLENAAHDVVQSESEAEARVTTEVKGQGKAVFDRKLGAVREFKLTGEAVSKAIKLKSQEQSERRLKTTLNVVLKPI